MKKIKCAIQGMNIGKPLIDAGVLGPNTGDFVIYVPVAGAVTIYALSYPGDEEAIEAAIKGIAEAGILKTAIEDIAQGYAEKEAERQRREDEAISTR